MINGVSNKSLNLIIYAVRSRKFVILLLVVSTFLVDQITKIIVRSNLAYFQKVTILDSYLFIIRIENKGAFLSTGELITDIIRTPLLIALPLLVLFYILNYILTNTTVKPTLLIGTSVLIGGGLGNIFDRLIHEGVTDFIFFNIFPLKGGIFNIADIAIFIGVVICLYFKIKA